MEAHTGEVKEFRETTGRLHRVIFTEMIEINE
jgi:hypothetical protein